MFGFKQLITKPTRYNENNATLIDIIVSNNSVHIPSTEVIPMSLSDHEMIGFTRKLNNNKYTPQEINCRDYRNYDPERMRNELKGIDWNNMYEITKGGESIFHRALKKLHNFKLMEYILFFINILFFKSASVCL